jgi:hypothetical protein
MSIPQKTCSKCGEDFYLTPTKPGKITECLRCSTRQPPTLTRKQKLDAALELMKKAGEQRDPDGVQRAIAAYIQEHFRS